VAKNCKSTQGKSGKNCKALKKSLEQMANAEHITLTYFVQSWAPSIVCRHRCRQISSDRTQNILNGKKDTKVWFYMPTDRHLATATSEENKRTDISCTEI
jgi:hypothetical protein